MYFGVFMFFEETFNIVTTKDRDSDDNPTDRLVLDTIIFHSFILLNIFNMINARVIDPEELNVFKTLFNNLLFWIVVVFELFVQ